MDPKALISSTSSLNSISRSFSGLAAGISRSSFLTRSIAKTINQDNRNKKVAITDDGKFFRRRRESILRRKREEQLEASGVSGILKQKGKVIKDTGKGFLGRVLSLIGIILLGFLVTKLPAIIKGVQGLIKNIQKAVGILTGFVNGVINIFEGMGKRLDQIIGFLNPFDGLGQQRDESQKIVEDIQKKQIGLTNGFINSVNRYKDDSELDEIIGEIEEKRNRPWWDPLGITDVPEGEEQEKTDKEKYDESKSDGDKSWNELSDKEKQDFLNKNAKIEGAKELDFTNLNQGGELKKGEAAIVGDDAKGKGKDRELFIPNQDGFILPNNISEKFLEASSFLESKKKKFDLEPEEGYANIEGMFSGFGVDSSISKSTKNKIDPSSIFGSGFMTSDAESSVDVEGVMSSLMSIGKTLMPEMKSVANELKDVIDTPEVQSKFETVKKSMQGVIKEITPKRKGATIMIPTPQASQSKSSGAGGVAPLPRRGTPSGGVNIKEYHKHLTTLVTSYT